MPRNRGRRRAGELAGVLVPTIRHYYPDWDPPDDTGRDWAPTLCPFHAESNPSASIALDRGLFRCFACPVRGNYLSVIMHEEGCDYRKAIRIAESILAGRSEDVRAGVQGQPGRKVLGRPRFGRTDSQAVRPGVRGRASPWA